MSEEDNEDRAERELSDALYETSVVNSYDCANDFICSDDVNVDGSDYERIQTSKTNGDY